MKKLLILLMPIVMLTSWHPPKPATETINWQTDIVKANEMSKTTKKPLFVLFTGSDWCVWCKKLQADVFSKAEFIKWCNANVIPVELDFPRYKQLPTELAQQNNSLQQAMGVQGYPTIWVMYMKKQDNGAGFNIEPLGQLGYPQGAQPGREEVKFIADAKAVLSKPRAH